MTNITVAEEGQNIGELMTSPSGTRASQCAHFCPAPWLPPAERAEEPSSWSTRASVVDGKRAHVRAESRVGILLADSLSFFRVTLRVPSACFVGCLLRLHT